MIAPGITVPTKAPAILRVVSNGRAAGAGLRIYVPTETTKQLGLKPGTFYRLVRTVDGRLQCTPVDPLVREAARAAGPDAQLPGDKIRLELSQREAARLEFVLSLDNRLLASPERSLMIAIGKRLRRRMRLIGWPTPDRTEDHLERCTS